MAHLPIEDGVKEPEELLKEKVCLTSAEQSKGEAGIKTLCKPKGGKGLLYVAGKRFSRRSRDIDFILFDQRLNQSGMVSFLHSLQSIPGKLLGCPSQIVEVALSESKTRQILRHWHS